MKKFILRVICFGTSVVAAIGGCCAIELWQEVVTYYSREVIAPEGACILVGNDSQTCDGIDSDTYPQIFNFSAPARRMDQACFALKDVLKANPGRFKTVLVDLSPIAAVEKFDRPIAELGYAAQYYLLHWLHWRENARDMSGALKVCRDNMVGRRLRHFWRAVRGKKKFVSSIGGGFRPLDECQLVQDPEYFRRQCDDRVRYFNSQPAVEPESDIFRSVDAIGDAVKAAGAELVLMTTPLHMQLVSACDRDKLCAFSETVRRYAASRNCRYLDFLREELESDCWFDAQHLNARGARKFTKRLLKEFGYDGSKD